MNVCHAVLSLKCGESKAAYLCSLFTILSQVAKTTEDHTLQVGPFIVLYFHHGSSTTAKPLNVIDFYFISRILLNFLEFHMMFLNILETVSEYFIGDERCHFKCSYFI